MTICCYFVRYQLQSRNACTPGESLGITWPLEDQRAHGVAESVVDFVENPVGQISKWRLEYQQECVAFEGICNVGLNVCAFGYRKSVDERYEAIVGQRIVELLCGTKSVIALVAEEHTAVLVFDTEFFKEESS